MFFPKIFNVGGPGGKWGAKNPPDAQINRKKGPKRMFLKKQRKI